MTEPFIVLSGYELPWEDAKFVYPNNMAPPIEIAVEASNGASDYGNKFGEPVLAGFARSFGMMLPNCERREWVKPIMFSGGIGMIDGESVSKLQPEKGEFLLKCSAIIILFDEAHKMLALFKCWYIAFS